MVVEQQEPPIQELKSHFDILIARKPGLRAEPLAERKKRLRNLESWLHKHRERIKKAVHQDYRKPLLEVDTTEIYPVLTELRHALKHLDEWAQPKKVDATLSYVGTRSEVRYEPRGTCLIIAPWNFPFNLCVGPLVSCLAAGNNAIIKPSEMTPHTSRLIVEMVREVFSEDIARVVEGGAGVTQELLKLPFDHIFFTGSTGVGKIVMQAAASQLSSVTLELGGKTPTIVDEAVNLKDAARRIAFGKFFNNGQTCIAPDYVLVHQNIREKFLVQLIKEIQLIFGDGGEIREESPSYSRLATSRQFNRISALITDARERGAKIQQLGGINQQTNFIGPTILTDIQSEARVWDEEIFGPILPVETFSTREEAAAIINRRPKPLALYVFSTRKTFQDYFLTNTTAGSVCINECVLQFTHPNLPFGGVNQSGLGKSHGQYGFIAFSNEKSVLRQKSGWAAPYLLYPPYTTGMKKIVDVLLKWF